MHQINAQTADQTPLLKKQKTRNKRAPGLGKVMFDGQDNAVHCMVREISDQHAVLTMSGWIGFPSEFTLHVEPDSLRAKCQVTNRRGSTVEVSFTEVEYGERLKAR